MPAVMRRSQRPIVKRAALHGCKVAATTKVAHRLVRCSLTKEVNRPHRRQDVQEEMRNQTEGRMHEDSAGGVRVERGVRAP